MVTIRLRRDSAANWSSANPVLAMGEPGYETDTKKLKVGDGATAWNSLAYHAPTSHTHSAADITSGTLDAARIGSGSITSDKLSLSMTPSWTGVHTHSARPVFNGGINAAGGGVQVGGTQVIGSDYSIRDVIWDRRYNPGSRVFFAEYGPNLIWNAEQIGYTASWSSLTGVTYPGNIWIPDTNDRYTALDMATCADPLTIELTGTLPITTNVGTLRVFLAWHGGAAFNNVSFEVKRNDDVWVPFGVAYTSGGLVFSETLNSAAPYPTYTSWKGIRVVLTNKAVSSGSRYLYGVGLYGARAFAYPYLVNKIGDTLYGTLATQELRPRTHNTYDLGASGVRYKDAYLQGNLNVAGTVDGRDISADGTKLDTIASGAQVNPSAADIFSAVLGLDGPGSGLHADLLDTYEASAFPRKLESAVIDGSWQFDAPLQVNDELQVAGTIFGDGGLDILGNIALTGTVDGRDVAADGSVLDALAALGSLATTDQVLTSNRNVTNAAGGQYLLVNLTASGSKSAIFSVAPTNPSVALSINDGAGQAAALQFGSAGAFWTMTGAMDWRINSDPGELHSVWESQGSGAAPKWARDMPNARYLHTDFCDRNVHTNDPFFGTAISSGTQSATPPVWALAAFGACNMRSSATANSGWRWQTHTGAFYGKAGMYFRARLGIPDDMNNKTVRFGFIDTTTHVDCTDGTYFELGGTLTCVAKSANNSTRTTGGTSYTLSVDTYYIFEIEWESASSVNFKISSEDGSTVHLDVDITTNLPSAYPRVFGAGIVATSSGTAIDDLVCIDYMGIGLRGIK